MDTYIKFRIDSEMKETLKESIKKKEPNLVNKRSDGISAILTRYIHEYIKDAE